MSKTKGSAQQLFKPAPEEIDHNLEVAVWGRFSEKRYLKAREIVEGWTLRKIAGKGLFSRHFLDPAIRDRMECVERETIEFVGNAIKNRDAAALRKLADVLDQLMVAATPRAVLIIAYVRATGKIKKGKPTFRQIRNWIADVEDLKPPFDETFNKSVSRLIKQLGIEIGR